MCTVKQFVSGILYIQAVFKGTKLKGGSTDSSPVPKEIKDLEVSTVCCNVEKSVTAQAVS